MRYTPVKQFKAALKSGQHPECFVAKATASVAESVGGRALKFTISTDAVDRDNDVINQKGWVLKNYLKNPVTLWSHRGDEPPIGKTVWIGNEDDSLKAVVEFVPANNPLVGDMAEGIYQMCKDGFISATSVGFMPLEYELTTDKSRGADGWNPGVDHLKQELFELSIVPVPANPEALIERVSVLDMPKGISTLDITRTLNNNDREKRQRLIALYSTGDKI